MYCSPRSCRYRSHARLYDFFFFTSFAPFSDVLEDVCMRDVENTRAQSQSLFLVYVDGVKKCISSIFVECLPLCSSASFIASDISAPFLFCLCTLLWKEYLFFRHLKCTGFNEGNIRSILKCFLLYILEDSSTQITDFRYYIFDLIR